MHAITDYGHPVRKSTSLLGWKANPNPKFIGKGRSKFYLTHRHKISGFFVLCPHILGVRSPCMQSSQFRNSLVQVMCNADWNSLGKSKWHRFVVSVIIHTYICLNINWKRNSLTYRWRLDQKEFHFGCRKIFFRSTGWKKEKKVIKIIILMRLIYICLLKVNKHQSVFSFVWAGKNLTCPKNCTTFNLNSSFPVHKTKLKK